MSLPVLTPADEYVDPRTAPLPRHFEFSSGEPNSFAVVLGRGARRRHPELFSEETFASPLKHYPPPRESDPENPCPGVYIGEADGGAGVPAADEGDDEDDDESGNVVDFLSELPKAPRAPTPVALIPAQSAWRGVLENHLLAAGLAPADVEAFVGELRVARFSRGDVVLKRGAVGDRAFFVVSGSVDAVQGALGSRDCTCVAQLHAGDSFGFVSLVAMQAREASPLSRGHAAHIPAAPPLPHALCRSGPCRWSSRASWAASAASSTASTLRRSPSARPSSSSSVGMGGGQPTSSLSFPLPITLELMRRPYTRSLPRPSALSSTIRAGSAER